MEILNSEGNSLTEVVEILRNLALESGESAISTQGNYLAGYYIGTRHAALITIELLERFISGNELLVNGQLPLIED